MKTLTNNTTTNILSIDIDYAYSPTISVYDDYIEGVRISEEEQELILQKHNVPKPICNPEKIKVLESVIKNNINLNAPIILIENHDQILDFLPSDRKLSIYNFDHHHDVYYPGWHSLDTLDEGNWVYFLKDKNVLEYIWVYCAISYLSFAKLNKSVPHSHLTQFATLSAAIPITQNPTANF